MSKFAGRSGSQERLSRLKSSQRLAHGSPGFGSDGINHPSIKAVHTPQSQVATHSTSEEDPVATLQRERVQQEARNARVLALLRTKDDAIDALEARCAESAAQVAQLHAQLQTSSHQLDSSQARVEELAQANSALLRKATEAQREAAAAREAAVRDAGAAEELKASRSEAATAKGQVASLTAALQAADEVMEDMQAELHRREREQEEQASRIHQLEAYVARLLGLAKADGEVVTRIEMQRHHLYGDVHSNDTHKNSDEETIRGLRAANEALERALVTWQLRAAGLTSTDLDDPDAVAAALSSGRGTTRIHADGTSRTGSAIDPEDEDEVVALASEVARLRGELEGSQERRLQLEAANDVAQRAAMHAEAELSAALSRQTHLTEDTAMLQAKLAVAEAHAAEVAAQLEQVVASKRVVDDELEAARKNADANSEAGRAQIQQLTAKVENLQIALESAQRAAQEAKEAAEAAAGQADKDRLEAIERLEVAGKQAATYKAQLLEAQTENDQLKAELRTAERNLASLGAKEAAQEAARAAQAQWQEVDADGDVEASQGGNTPSLSLKNLAHQLHEASKTQISLRHGLAESSQQHVADQKTIVRLQTSLHRLRAALAASTEENEQNIDMLLGSETGFAADDAIEQLHRQVSTLQNQLEMAAAAQQGQAAAFAAAIKDKIQRESELHGRLRQQEDYMQSTRGEASRFQNLCISTVEALHSSLAHVAIAEGDDAAAESMLRAEPCVDQLEAVVAMAAETIQQHATWIVHGHDQVAHDLEEKTLLANETVAAQRDVIARLATQLAKDADSVDLQADKGGLGGDNGNHRQHHHPKSVQASTVPVFPSNDDAMAGNNQTPALGLCTLLSRQLVDVAAAVREKKHTPEAILGLLESARGTLLVLRFEFLQRQPGCEPANALALTARAATMGHSPSMMLAEGAKADQEASLLAERQVLELTERLAVLTERAALLTAANEAAQAEAAHGRAAASELAQALDAERTRRQRETALAAEKEASLERRIEQMELACNKLSRALDKAREERRAAAGGVVAERVNALQRQLRDAAGACLDGKDGEESKVSPTLMVLLDGLDALLQDAVVMEERIVHLESTAAEMKGKRRANAQETWSRLTAAALRARDVAATRAEARQDIETMRERCRRSTQRVKALESESANLKRQLKVAEEEHARLDETHASQAAALEARARAEKAEARRKIDAAAEVAEQKSRDALKSEMDDVHRALKEAKHRCAVMQAKHDAVVSEFRNYRNLKCAEISSLEQRLKSSMHVEQEQGPTTNAMDRDRYDSGALDAQKRLAEAHADIEAACRQEAVAAVMRELRLERSHRLRVQDALSAAKESERQALFAVKEAEREIQALQGKLREALAVRDALQAQDSRQAVTNEAMVQEQVQTRDVEDQRLRTQVAQAAKALEEQQLRVREAMQREGTMQQALKSSQEMAMDDVAQRVMRLNENVRQVRIDVDAGLAAVDATLSDT